MLYIVATPIGNLEDITLRALRVLKEADFVVSEDTRVTRKLLSHFDIQTKTISFHAHSTEKEIENILNLLKEGKNLALVTDAGTPAVSDPGSFLVSLVREKLPEEETGVKIVPIPGVSALITAFSISGLKDKEFIFMGFPPHKKGRQTFFKEILNQKYPVIFYESKHRLVKALENINEIDPKKRIVIAKELTKINENILIGSADDLIKRLEENSDLKKGEFVIIVDNS